MLVLVNSLMIPVMMVGDCNLISVQVIRWWKDDDNEAYVFLLRFDRRYHPFVLAIVTIVRVSIADPTLLCQDGKVLCEVLRSLLQLSHDDPL